MTARERAEPVFAKIRGGAFGEAAIDEIERAIAAAVKEECEACAQIVESSACAGAGAEAVAEKIRARSKPESGDTTQ